MVFVKEPDEMLQGVLILDRFGVGNHDVPQRLLPRSQEQVAHPQDTDESGGFVYNVRVLDVVMSVCLRVGAQVGDDLIDARIGRIRQVLCHHKTARDIVRIRGQAPHVFGVCFAQVLDDCACVVGIEFADDIRLLVAGHLLENPRGLGRLESLECIGCQRLGERLDQICCPFRSEQAEQFTPGIIRQARKCQYLVRGLDLIK